MLTDFDERTGRQTWDTGVPVELGRRRQYTARGESRPRYIPSDRVGGEASNWVTCQYCNASLLRAETYSSKPTRCCDDGTSKIDRLDTSDPHIERLLTVYRNPAIQPLSRQLNQYVQFTSASAYPGASMGGSGFHYPAPTIPYGCMLALQGRSMHVCVPAEVSGGRSVVGSGITWVLQDDMTVDDVSRSLDINAVEVRAALANGIVEVRNVLRECNPLAVAVNSIRTSLAGDHPSAITDRPVDVGDIGAALEAGTQQDFGFRVQHTVQPTGREVAVLFGSATDWRQPPSRVYPLHIPVPLATLREIANRAPVPSQTPVPPVRRSLRGRHGRGGSASADPSVVLGTLAAALRATTALPSLMATSRVAGTDGACVCGRWPTTRRAGFDGQARGRGRTGRRAV